ncbi:MAG: efflux RND transporter periplasmic adaptor subunit [Ginsengibacter sp.]
MKSIYQSIIILSSIIYAGCSGKTEIIAAKKEPIISDSLLKIITIDTVKMDNIEDLISLSGEVDNDDNKVVKIFPNASGQVVSVNVSLGDKVAKGQALAVIKSADVAGNYADLKIAGSDAAIAEKEFVNAGQLYKSGIGSEKEYIEAKLEYEKSMNAVSKVHAQIQINGGGKTSAGGTYVISSPRNGYVVEKNINAGSFIRNDNAQNLFTISDMQDVWVWANVFETDINKIKVGTEAAVTTLAYPDKIFYGKVDHINAVLDPSSKAMKVKIVLPNRDLLLKPEMFTKIVIADKQDKKALEIPGKALVFDGGKNYVILYKDTYNISAEEVDIIKTVGDKTYIREGLHEGDRIVSSNQLLLYNSLNGD